MRGALLAALVPLATIDGFFSGFRLVGRSSHVKEVYFQCNSQRALHALRRACADALQKWRQTEQIASPTI